MDQAQQRNEGGGRFVLQLAKVQGGGVLVQEWNQAIGGSTLQLKRDLGRSSAGLSMRMLLIIMRVMRVQIVMYWRLILVSRSRSWCDAEAETSVVTHCSSSVQ